MVKRSQPASSSPPDLRERAEALLRLSPTEIADLLAADIQVLIHELQVHQIELEMQNEELHKSQQELQESGDRFTDLYDFAPVGYLTLDAAGNIVEANLTAAKMLGIERARLVGSKLSAFVAREDQDTFYFHRLKLFGGQPASQAAAPDVHYDTGQTCKLEMRKADGVPLWCRLECCVFRTSDTPARKVLPGVPDLLCRTALIDITERKQAEEALRRAHDELEKRRTAELTAAYERLRNLSGYLLNVREEERARIAREIHDELGGTLTAIKMELSHIGKSQENGADLSYSIHLVESAIQSVRKVITDLRPSVLDNFGLWAALEWLAQDVEKRTGIHCHTFVDDSAEAFEPSPEIATSIFRIVQEALTNVARHAQASEAWVRASRTDGELEVEIEDNGKGITEAEMNRPEAWGILGMSERVKLHGGRLAVTGEMGGGTRIIARIPMGRFHDYEENQDLDGG
jgi:PAS domain S-box-containing protein